MGEPAGSGPDNGPGTQAFGRVLVTAATHGNEPNAAWLLESWQRHPDRIDRSALDVEAVVANPEALAANRRYLDCDLNRSFHERLLEDPACGLREVQRARFLLARHGAGGSRPCQVAVDLHSTTAAMGSCLVLYGRRPADLALAAGIQAALGLPVYLHEGDPSQTGFLVACWPCGLVIEVGPVAQGVLDSRIIRQSALALEAALAVLGSCRDAGSGRAGRPDRLEVHRHLGSLDVPRDAHGEAMACIHPERQGRDWRPMGLGDPLFERRDGGSVPLRAGHLAGMGSRLSAGADLVPVFINEAAYGEKGIALSLTSRETWPVDEGCWQALVRLMRPG